MRAIPSARMSERTPMHISSGRISPIWNINLPSYRSPCPRFVLAHTSALVMLSMLQIAAHPLAGNPDSGLGCLHWPLPPWVVGPTLSFWWFGAHTGFLGQALVLSLLRPRTVFGTRLALSLDLNLDPATRVHGNSAVSCQLGLPLTLSGPRFTPVAQSGFHVLRTGTRSPLFLFALQHLGSPGGAYSLFLTVRGCYRYQDRSLDAHASCSSNDRACDPTECCEGCLLGLALPHSGAGDGLCLEAK